MFNNMCLEMSFYSHELRKNMQVYVLLPRCQEEKNQKCKTLWLFHGLSGDHTSWIRQTSIERYAQKNGIAVVMPNVDRSRYTDTAYDANYFSFVTKELPELCRNTFKQMSEKREDNIVAGVSMGGYGAMKVALTCPEQYGKCVSLSGSMDITRKGREYPLNEWKAIFDFEMESADELEGGCHDLFALASSIKNDGRICPDIYMWCGTEDYLLGVNHLFDKHLTELGISHVFETSEGNHSWKWWDLHIQDALKWALNN